ncbi:MAG: hypothetical protein KGJ78_14245 [Alphaproteobacteria bacterium]|nr:hypothetical protein [Alphaproteobacteria bacterium]
MRTLIAIPVLAVVLFFAGLYAAYGQADPCRAFAVERARRSAMPTAVMEPWARLATSQMSTGTCVKGLFRSWFDRAREETN